MKFISYQEKRNKRNRLIRRYKIYNFLFFKIKKKVLPVLGDNNKIIIGGREITQEEKKLLDKYGKITIEGNNNIIELPNIDNLMCDIFIEGNENKICIGKFNGTARLDILLPDYQNNRELIIKDSDHFVNVSFDIRGNNRKIYVGKNCMFSTGIYIKTTDHHPIYDLDTTKRVNEEQDIIIGDHVWIGQDVHVLKGSIIPSGCVVGTRSLVNKKFTQENCIIAGSPAKVVKENIRWEP